MSNGVLINPPAARLGASNAILWGRGQRRYYVLEFPGPLSIKSIVTGAGEWSAENSRFEVDSNSYLILNRDQPYSLTIDSKTPVETFCVFFSKGFVEDAWRSSVTEDAALLDEPAAAGSIGFYQTLHRQDRLVTPILRELREKAVRGESDLEESFFKLAPAMIGLKSDWSSKIGRLPGVRLSTREELFRRAYRGKQMMDELFGESLTLDDIARAAASRRSISTACSKRYFTRRRTSIYGAAGWNARRACCGKRKLRCWRSASRVDLRVPAVSARCSEPGLAHHPGSFAA